jgi:hypothetical protein
MDKALYRAYVAVQQNNKARTIRGFGAVLAIQHLRPTSLELFSAKEIKCPLL